MKVKAGSMVIPYRSTDDKQLGIAIRYEAGIHLSQLRRFVKAEVYRETGVVLTNKALDKLGVLHNLELYNVKDDEQGHTVSEDADSRDPKLSVSIMQEGLEEASDIPLVS